MRAIRFAHWPALDDPDIVASSVPMQSMATFFSAATAT